MLAVAALAVLFSQDTTRIPQDAYADQRTAELVSLARGARDRNERLVTHYTANVTQRLGVGIRAASRDRMLYRQELAAKIEWKRDSPSRIEVTGAREGVPVVWRNDQIPEDLEGQLDWLVVNPAEDYLRIAGIADESDDDDDGFIYPLREGGERDYRFAAGDSTVIALPSGRRIRLVELEITPRRSDWKLIAGSLWFDADTYGLVRAVFRPARPFEFRRDIDQEDKEDVPAWVNPRGEVKYVTLEYGLYEDRWWMLRYAALEAYGSMGSWLGMPIKLERVYSDYEVEGGTPPDPDSRFVPAGSRRRHRFDEDGVELDSVARKARADSIERAIDACIDTATSRDSMRTETDRRQVRRRIGNCHRRFRGDSTLAIVIPDDTAALATSPTLGPPILQMGDMIDEDEIRGLADFIDGLPARPWQAMVEMPRGMTALLQRARYNRVEALSLGYGARADFGKLSLDGQARIGVADGWPNLEGGLTWAPGSGDHPIRLAGYRRLAAANPETRPFGVINSVFGFLAHRDDGEYFRATGLDLTRTSRSGGLSARLYVERQEQARVETDFSLPRIFGSNAIFRPNIAAVEAEQAGVAITMRGQRAFSRTFAMTGQLEVEAATGDFEFGRTGLTIRGLVTPDGPIAVALAASAGTSAGTVPIQSRFFLGGPATLRGYDGGVMSGDAFWSARAEVANSFPAARVSLFTDVGWAGPRDTFSSGRPLIGGGIGGSFMDGLIRVDLSRGFRGPTGWRFDLYFDGVL